MLSETDSRTTRVLNTLITVSVATGMFLATGNMVLWKFSPVMWGISLVFFTVASLVFVGSMGKEMLPRTGLEGIFVLGAIAWGLSLAFARHPQRGWEPLAMTTGYVILFYGALVLLGRGVSHQRVVDGLLLVSGWVGAMAVAEIYWWYEGFWQVAGSRSILPPFPYRVISIIGHPNPFMAVMNLYAPLAALHLCRGGVGRRTGAFLWLILYAFALPFSSSRSGWLGALVGWGSLMLFWGWDVRHKVWEVLRRHWKRMALVVVLCFVIAFGVARLGYTYFSAHPSHGAGTLAQSRTGIWGFVLQAWREHPLTGVGAGNFMLAYLEHSRDFPGGFLAPHAHNVYLQVLTEFGIIGLVVFILLIVKLFYRIWMVWRHTPINSPLRMERAVFMASLLTLIAHGIGDDISFSPVIIGGAVLITAMAWDDGKPNAPRLPLRSIWLLLPMVFVIGLGVRAWWGALPAVKAAQAFQQGDALSAALRYEEVVRRNPADFLYRQQAGMAAAWAWQASGDTRWLELARQRMESVLKEEPAPAHWHATLAGIYVAEGKLEAAWQSIKEARARARNEPSFALYAGWIAEQLGWQEQALEAYREGLRLDPLLTSSLFWEETPLRRQARDDASLPRQDPFYWQEALAALETGKMDKARQWIAFSRAAGEKGFSPQVAEWRVALAVGDMDWALRSARNLRDGLGRVFTGSRGYYLAGYLDRAVFPVDIPPNFLFLSPQDGRLEALAWLWKQEMRAGNCTEAQKTWKVEQGIRQYGMLSSLPEVPACP